LPVFFSQGSKETSSVGIIKKHRTRHVVYSTILVLPPEVRRGARTSTTSLSGRLAVICLGASARSCNLQLHHRARANQSPVTIVLAPPGSGSRSFKFQRKRASLRRSGAPHSLTEKAARLEFAVVRAARVPRTRHWPRLCVVPAEARTGATLLGRY